MKTSRESFAKTRRKIIETAGRLFVEKGFSNVGIVEVMKAAGLTHGGFYGHFGSKNELAFEATKLLFAEYEERWRSVLTTAPETPLAALVADFFSSPADSQKIGRCILAPLAQEAGHSDPAVRKAFSNGIEALLCVLEEAMPVERHEKRVLAMATLSSMVGAATLAGALDDPVLVNGFLSSASDKVSKLGALPATGQARYREI
jgi:TetR/AcrR family transcriptional repressor of nem operon